MLELPHENRMQQQDTVVFEDEFNENVPEKNLDIDHIAELSRIETLGEVTARNRIFYNGGEGVFFSEFKKGLDVHIDFQFPPNSKSVVGNCRAFKRIESDIKFRRVGKIYKNEMNFKLADDDQKLKHFQVYPNYFGNFMFCLALMIIDKHRQILQRVMNNQEVNQLGMYTFNLYINHKWQTVEVDDFLPVFKKVLLFCTSNTNELWPTLLEKAYSKAIGSYFEASRIFDLGDILMTLTGFPSRKIFLEEEKGIENLKKHFQFLEKTLKEGNIVILKTKGNMMKRHSDNFKQNH